MKLYIIKDISQKIGKDKSNVYRYIKRNSIAHTTTRGQTLMYSEQQKNAIISGMTSDSNATVVQRSQQSKTEHDEKTIVVKSLEERIDDLKRQNEILVSQLHQKDREINETHKLIDQEQQLHLSDQKRIKELEQPGKDQKTDTIQNNSVDNQQQNQSKKGFFKRLFGK